MKSRTTVSSVIKEYLQIVIIFFMVFTIVYLFIGQLFEVTGDSMFPTFRDKEQVIAEKISVNFTNLERGDIIIFKNQYEGNKLLIKRVVALPGERFQIRDGNVYINGELLPEPYLEPDTRTYGQKILEQDFEYTVPLKSYVALGDNREQSTDSREWGYVKSENIVGKVAIVYFPLKNLRIIQNTGY